ncbi:MAG: hypothetical protein HY754_05155 [Nitrospirae bacterium]|nr:hypothetical protein [Nitrospirota bacterium]
MLSLILVPTSVGTPRLLPLYCLNYSTVGLSAKESVQTLSPPVFIWKRRKYVEKGSG